MTRNPQFIMREVAGKRLIVPVGEAAETYHGMLTVNGTGAYLWELLAQPHTVESLTSAMLDAYDVSPEVALADAKAFVEKLRKVGAVTE